MHNIIETARHYANKGHSFSFTAQMTGVGRKRLRRILDDSGEPIEFLKGTATLGFRLALEELHANLKGKPASPGSLAALERTREKRSVKYAAFGANGTLPDLVRRFGCPVSIKSVRSRVAGGMSVEDALTLPMRTPRKGLYPPQIMDWLQARRRNAAVDIMLIVKSRLTDTMLRFSDTNHVIEIVDCENSTITVEVRTLGGQAVHRLRFLKTFDTGVLFVFNPEIDGRIQFIAFEPSNPCILRA